MKIKKTTPVCDYLEGLLNKAFAVNKNYPAVLKLSPASYKKFQAEIKGIGGWADHGNNYRGIEVRIYKPGVLLIKKGEGHGVKIKKSAVQVSCRPRKGKARD